MKTKLLILIIATFIAAQTIFAQSVEKQVSAIRAEVAAINKNAKSYTKKTKDVEGVSLEGTEATYFTSGRGLHKITAKMYGETFQATGEYYFQGEELIFAYEKMSRYNGQIGMSKPVKVVKIEEKRLYFSNGKLIKLLVGKISVKSGSQQWEESEKDSLDLVKTFKDAL
ncbi:MAG TPA: hypothetical protein PKY82_22470 [Pyrinomonadaceae bacterium]|nr:hypothetical protein [Pyrinomonadaceae bacterium]